MNRVIIILVLLSLSIVSKAQEENSNSGALLEGFQTGAEREKIEEDIEKKKDLKARKIKKVASLASKKGDIYNAIDFYEVYLSKKEGDLKALNVLSHLYLKARDHNNAFIAFNKLFLKDSLTYPLAQFYYASLLSERGKCDSAIGHLQRFAKRYKGPDYKVFKKKAKAKIASCDFQKENTVPKDIEIGFLDTVINHRYTDFAPVFINDSSIIYSSLKPEGFLKIGDRLSVQVLKYTNIYEAQKVDSSWQNVGIFSAVDVEEWIGKYEAANGAFSPDGQRFYFSLCDRQYGNKMHCQIAISEREENGKWSKPVALEEPINHPKFTSTQPTVGIESKKGREVLYFISDREGGRGGMDIWYTIRHPRKGTYSSPRNAGKGINTVGDEMTPMLDNGYKTLYFSSDFWAGYGGLDIFSAIGELKKWSAPMNLGLPINSNYDDLYYSQDSKRESGFVVSNREGSMSLKHEGCCDDIFTFKKLHIVRLAVNGSVKKEDSTEFAGGTAALYLVDSSSGEDLLLRYETLGNDGDYFFDLEPNKNYKVVIVKDGYLNNATSFSTDTNTVSDTFMVSDIYMQRPTKPIRLDNILYASGEYGLSDPVKKSIDTTLFVLIEANPQIQVEISSHTDNVGDAKSNMKLSVKRASYIIDYLVEKGIDKSRLKSKGYGETLPIASNETEEGRSMNRRTEFRVIGKVKTKSSSKSKKRKDEEED